MIRRSAVLGNLVLGAGVLGAGAMTWISATGSTVLDPSVAVTATGTSAAPAAGAAALVVVAGALALGLVGRAGRWIVLGVQAVAGAAIAVSALSVALSPRASAVAAAVDATGVTEIVGPVEVRPAAWVTVALGLAIVALAAWSAWSARSWPSRSTRHEMASPTGAAADDREVWDALSNDEDPT